MLRLLGLLLLLSFSAPLAAQNSNRTVRQEVLQARISEKQSAQSTSELLNESGFILPATGLSGSEAFLLLKQLRSSFIAKKNSAALFAFTSETPLHLFHARQHVLHPGERLLRIMKMQC